MRKRMLNNKIQCVKCQDVIESFSRHDFKSCSCGNCFVDAGVNTGYYRRGGEFYDLSVWDNGSHVLRRENCTWGRNYDKNMRLLPKTQWITIDHLDAEHIWQILLTVKNLDNFYTEVFTEELIFREQEEALKLGLTYGE